MTWTTRPRSSAGALAAIEAGSGERVLLLHGVGLRAEAWGAQIGSLAGSCSVVAVDLPGHGHSVPLGPDAGLPAFTDRVAAAMNGPAMVIGHSFGAMIALDLAIRHPGLVKGVVAMNAVYRRSPAAKAAVSARAQALDGQTLPDPSPTLERWYGAAESPERNACRTWLCAMNPASYRSAYRVFAEEDGPSDSTLKALPCPALFMTGGLEPNSTPDMSREMATIVPQGRFEVQQDAAHMMPMTHASQVNSAIARFIDRCAPPAQHPQPKGT